MPPVRTRYSFRKTSNQRLYLRLVCILGLALMQSATFSAKIKAFQIKAAYLVHIPKNVTWPESSFKSSDSPFHYCLLDSGDVSETVKETLEDKSVRGRKIIFHTEVSLDTQCHIIFLSKTKKALVSQVFTIVEGKKDILTIGDFEEFANSGGMIHFYNEGKRVKIAIDLTAILDTDLKISSKLIKIANIEF